jgi:hypothetical protein
MEKSDPVDGAHTLQLIVFRGGQNRRVMRVTEHQLYLQRF